MLEVRDIHASYGPIPVLQGVSLRIERGQTVALLGRNGVGKTTLVHTIMGLTPLHSGSIVFNDREISRLSIHRIAQLGIALVPQGRRIFSSLTVRENLDLAFRNPGDQSGPIWDFEAIFELFPILLERRAQYAGTLSGGEQQMLACARALIANPHLLLMDEPSEGLAPQKLQELGDLMERLCGSGLAILLVEQNMRFALRYCNYVYVMHRGGIGFDGPPQTLIDDSEAQERLLVVGRATEG
jgi:branched-chain amino acid transport system ATP-binding protein